MRDNPLKWFEESLQKNNYKVKVNNSRLVAISHKLKQYSSIQLVDSHLPPYDLAKSYFHWLSSSSKHLIKVKEIENQFQLFLFILPIPLLILTVAEKNETTALFSVSGGLLAKPNQKGSFAFSCQNTVSVIALEHFQPRLPWLLYLATQAPLHELVMIAFQKKIDRTRVYFN